MTVASLRKNDKNELHKTLVGFVALMILLGTIIMLAPRAAKTSYPMPAEYTKGTVEVRSLQAPKGERFDLVTVEIGNTVKTYIRCGDAMVEWMPAMPASLNLKD